MKNRESFIDKKKQHLLYLHNFTVFISYWIQLIIWLGPIFKEITKKWCKYVSSYAQYNLTWLMNGNPF